MKNTILLILLCFYNLCYSQELDGNDWLLYENEKIESVIITETTELSVDRFIFKAVWNEKLNYSDNIGFYGGIAVFEIYKNAELITTIKDIEDVVALGEIYFEFYDYNFDGHLDFSYPINQGKSQWRTYYLFNPLTNEFKNCKDWDYLRIQKINKKTKQILSQPNGAALKGEQLLYKVNECELIKIKTIIH